MRTSHWSMATTTVLVIALVTGGCTGAPAAPAPPREADIVAVVNAFYGAISAGDNAAAMKLIAPDAVFVESGKIETRAEYEMNHLPADIEFEHQVKAER